MDYEPYFEMWNSVMHYPNPARNERTNPNPIHGHRGDEQVIPAHQHKTCQGLVRAVEKYPPRVCPVCGVDTALEVSQRSPGGVILSG